MGKISKFSNVYDKDGSIINHVDDDGKLKNMTVEQVQDLVKRLSEDKDENGQIRNQQAYWNAVSYLYQLYINNPEALMSQIQAKNKADEQEVAESLKEVEEAVEEIKPTVMDEYVDYEEVKE